MKNGIEKLIQKALKNFNIDWKVNFSIEHPEDFKNGDYSTNVAMVAMRSFAEIVGSNVNKFNCDDIGKNPRQFAEKIKDELENKLPKEIKKVEIAGPGFINFYLSEEFFVESIKEILKEKEDFGKDKIGQGEKVLVEYSSPNIAKPFTIGHLRSTIIGDSVSKILEFSGHKVTRALS